MTISKKFYHGTLTMIIFSDFCRPGIAVILLGQLLSSFFKSMYIIAICCNRRQETVSMPKINIIISHIHVNNKTI